MTLCRARVRSRCQRKTIQRLIRTNFTSCMLKVGPNPAAGVLASGSTGDPPWILFLLDHVHLKQAHQHVGQMSITRSRGLRVLRKWVDIRMRPRRQLLPGWSILRGNLRSLRVEVLVPWPWEDRLPLSRRAGIFHLQEVDLHVTWTRNFR